MLRALAALATTVLLMLGTTTVVQADRPNPRPGHASPEAVLAAAEALFSRTPERARGATAGREATMVLRDLTLVRDQLTGADRAAADAILARPTDGAADPFGHGYGRRARSRCTKRICVLWVEGGPHAVHRADRDRDKVPNYVERARSALHHVHKTYVSAGYQRPLSDGGIEGGPQTDVYLADVGDSGLYGYCVADDANPEGKRAEGGYCVLDNDYARRQFSTNRPVENLRVTAAHEYFHAVQFGYDLGEDFWFMEATATWAEDEVYDSVNDNIQYLPAGPLGRPDLSVDYGADDMRYGGWIFFRYLTERIRSSRGGMPTLVRDMWRRADSRGADKYSMQAVRREVRQRHVRWSSTFARFAEAGRRPRRVYDEGRAQRYPAAPLAFSRITLSRGQRSTGVRTEQLNHLTSASARIVPGRDLTNRRWKLRLRVDMANKVTGSVAIATIHHNGRRTQTRNIRLSSKGNGRVTVPFSRRRVRAVELTLVNTSTRYRCGQGTHYSCEGRSKDDFLRTEFKATALR
jgi:hypothetical protein